jgi:site-specific DNA recombinase
MSPTHHGEEQAMKRKVQQAERWDAGYPRVSTDIQVERDALQNQIQALEGHARAQGLNMRLYREEGVSAKDTDRPALQRLLADVRAGRVRSVTVTKLDRISRSLHDLLDLVKIFEEHEVKFVSLRDNIDTSGPVGRFMLHILGAIAELERGIIGERVAEDMKLRARRGKWNGGLAPYGRKLVDGQLIIVPDEAETLQRMRQQLLRCRSWRGVAIALNRAGLRTRGWEPIERDGHTIRKGHAPAEWTPVSVKRVLLQPINDGTLVYNRRRVVGRVAVDRPEDEHVVVEGFCEPIFTREELAELRRVAKEIEGTPPRLTGSPHLLSGLLRCSCGCKMYGVTYPVVTKRGSYDVRYYKCRRATSMGTCDTKNIRADVVEPVIVRELRNLSLDQDRVRGLAGDAQGTFEAALRPTLERRASVARELTRAADRSAALLELAEERLIGKAEFASRRAELEEERAALTAELAQLDAEARERSASTIDIEGTLRSLRNLGDVFDELRTVPERRHLLATCLERAILKPGEIELHVVASSLLTMPPAASDGVAEVPAQRDSGAASWENRAKNEPGFPDGVIENLAAAGGEGAPIFGIGEWSDARAASWATP